PARRVALARHLVRGAGARQRGGVERRAPGSAGRLTHHPRRVERQQELLNAQVNLVQARHDVQVSYYGVLAGIGRLTARNLALPVEYYDEERYYNEIGSRWIGWGTNDSGPKPIPAPTTTTSGGIWSKP